MVYRLWSNLEQGVGLPYNPLLQKLLQLTYLMQSESDTNSGHTSMESVSNFIGTQKGMTWITMHFKLLTITANKKTIYFFFPINFFQKFNFCNPSPTVTLSIPVGRQVTKYHIDPKRFDLNRNPLEVINFFVPPNNPLLQITPYIIFLEVPIIFFFFLNSVLGVCFKHTTIKSMSNNIGSHRLLTPIRNILQVRKHQRFLQFQPNPLLQFTP